MRPSLFPQYLVHCFQVLMHSPNPWRFLLGRLLVVSGLSERFVIRQAGYNLRFFPSNLSEQLFGQPTLRAGALRFFRRYLEPGDTVVDVGANIGDTSIVCGQAVGATGTVYAFEPHPRVFSWLVENVRLNHLSNVLPFNVALGAADDAVNVSNDRRDDMNRIVPESSESIRVSSRALDTALANLARVTLLKIDVEGFELFVLRGAVDTLKRASAIHIEVATDHFAKYDYGVSDVLTILALAGFSLFRGVDSDELVRVDTSYQPPAVENILAVRDVDDLERRMKRAVASLAPA